jgi:sortase A
VTRGDRVRQVLRGTGQLLITLGVIVLLFCVYELKVTSLYTAQQQTELEKRLTRTWASAPATPSAPGKPVPTVVPALGSALARIYLPTLGRSQEHVVVEGVGKEDLKRGPGHYPGTAAPGAIGNVVISGHRTTYGAPFNRLDELHVGDPIVLETKDFFYTYLVTGTTIVAPTALGETDPVPNRPGVKPTQRILTLTTCNPKYSAKTRLVVRGLLQSPLAKLGGALPPALVAAGYGRRA